MRIEYRSSNGRKLEVAAGRLVSVAPTSDVSANLRAHGCPEHLVERHEIRSRAAAAMVRGTTPGPSLAEIKAKAAAIGAKIAEDDRKFRERHS